MKTVRVNVKQIVRDIRAKKSDEDIMLEHSLSPRSLLKIKKLLLDRKLVSRKLLAEQGGGKLPRRRKVDAYEFLIDFRERPDDLHLMEKHGLKPRHLQRVYSQLIAKGMLSEYEYHTRDVKSPLVDETIVTPMAASTMIGLIEPPSRELGGFTRTAADPDLPSSFFRDHSGISIGGMLDGTGNDMDESTIIQVVTENNCPKCGCVRDAFATDTCESCGIVYAKYELALRKKEKAEEAKKKKKKNSDPS
jgi:hypothetical protein